MFELEAPSRLQKIEDNLLDEKGISLWLKREDEIHAEISGNKWRKLKYNFIEAKRKGYDKILTFGGAYSNHISATAAAAGDYGFHAIGIIRGDELNETSNPTLEKAHRDGMQLHFISRTEYSRRSDPDFLRELTGQHNAFNIPEGGTNELALLGVKELMSEININFDVICSAVGTGGTLAGISSALSNQLALGFATLKGANYLEKEVEKLIPDNNYWEINHDYHFGGYAKSNDALIEFVELFYKTHKVPLDPVYTGKMMYGLYDLIKKGHFKQGSKIIAVHTGGLQGIEGFNLKHGTQLKQK